MKAMTIPRRASGLVTMYRLTMELISRPAAMMPLRIVTVVTTWRSWKCLVWSSGSVGVPCSQTLCTGGFNTDRLYLREREMASGLVEFGKVHPCLAEFSRQQGLACRLACFSPARQGQGRSCRDRETSSCTLVAPDRWASSCEQSDFVAARLHLEPNG